MSQQVIISEFVQRLLSKQVPIIDVRSEDEFSHGHIPGAINLPLLKNEQRVIIGTTYKNSGREAAVKKGFELVGPEFSDLISKAEQLAPTRQAMLYCWRGGMRSSIMAWLLNLAGFRVDLLKGGYKVYRTWAGEQFKIRRNLVVIGGKTGTGKTELLSALQRHGEQTLDLESLASHKGSAFGGLGQKPQPTNEQFENEIALLLSAFSEKQRTWVENESHSIGSNIIPNGLFDQMRNAPVVEIRLDHETRRKRILNEYGIFLKEDLAANTKKVAKRLGGLRLKEALLHLENNDLSAWADILIHYYDETYNHSNKERDLSKISVMELSHDRMGEHIPELIKITKKFTCLI